MPNTKGATRQVQECGPKLRMKHGVTQFSRRSSPSAGEATWWSKMVDKMQAASARRCSWACSAHTPLLPPCTGCRCTPRRPPRCCTHVRRRWFGGARGRRHGGEEGLHRNAAPRHPRPRSLRSPRLQCKKRRRWEMRLRAPSERTTSRRLFAPCLTVLDILRSHALVSGSRTDVHQ